MKIAIAGSGAMGSRFGVMLKEAGNEVVLLDKWQAHIDAINEKGLIIHEDEQVRTVKMEAMRPEELKDIPDLIILFTKAMALPDMLEDIKKIMGSETRVLCLLNGLGHEETVARYIDRRQILMGVTMWTAGLVGPGEITLSGSGSIEVQNVDETQEKSAREVCDVLAQAKLKAVYSSDVILSIWKKACVNGTLNSLCTILDCNIGEFGALPDSEKMVRTVISEFNKVAHHFDVKLDEESVYQKVVASYDPKAAGNHYPSMHQDLIQHHRKTEIDYLNGYVATKAQQFSEMTPYCELITAQIHGKEQLLIQE